IPFRLSYRRHNRISGIPYERRHICAAKRWTSPKFSTEYPASTLNDSFVASASVLLLADCPMTQRYDAGLARKHFQDYAQDILDRWCRIAEQRLDHLIELYESGRWRRYHTERAFMENLLEAKTAVETWRALARREAMPNDRAIDESTLDQPAEASPAMQDEAGQSPARLMGTA